MGYVQSTADLNTYLTALYAARTAILLRKSYAIGGKTLTMADEKWISSEISETEMKLSRRSNGEGSMNPVFTNNRT